MAIKQTLQASKLFQSWPDESIVALAQTGVQRDLSPGEFLFMESDEAQSLFIVVTGTLRIQKSTTDQTQEVASIGPGSHLGELGMLGGVQKESRSGSASASEVSHLVEIPYKNLHQMLEGNPLLGMLFYKNLANTLAGRIRGTTEDLAGLKSRTLRNH